MDKLVRLLLVNYCIHTRHEPCEKDGNLSFKGHPVRRTYPRYLKEVGFVA